MKIISMFASSLLIFKSSLPLHDIYSRNTSMNQITVEHIIPKKYFLNEKHANTYSNLAFTDIKNNQLRADYAFGYFNPYNITTINHKTRTYYPSENADRGLIARSCIKMFTKYPYLYEHFNEIIKDPILLKLWCQYPVSLFEYQRNIYE